MAWENGIPERKKKSVHIYRIEDVEKLRSMMHDGRT